MTNSELAAFGAIAASLVVLTINAALEASRKRREKRTDAYVDLLKGMSMISTPDKTSEKYRDGQTLILDAKHRILLYGQQEVIDSLDAYVGGRIKGHWSHLDGEGRTNYANLIAAMQKDCRSSSSPTSTILTVLVDEASSDKLGPP